MSHRGNVNKNKTQDIKIREIAKAMLIKEMQMKTTMRYNFILNERKRLSFLIVQMQQSLL